MFEALINNMTNDYISRDISTKFGKFLRHNKGEFPIKINQIRFYGWNDDANGKMSS